MLMYVSNARTPVCVDLAVRSLQSEVKFAMFL